METTIITNVVLMTLLGIGFLSYLVWLGFKLVKLSGDCSNENREIHFKIERVDRSIHDRIDDINRELDRIDSRFDRKITEMENNIFQQLDIRSMDSDQRCQSIENHFQQAISDLVEDVDKLKK